ncbi:CST complex subunit STN1 isoform X2 [Benincasa hispida]|uniref:CST complex subunit STN1 isoform X2 n=1 Tax=Benincasa hispida TaxID=102211 RepID=UPI00190261C6|nr:CST complex subunit STN1 isoform X2 [Benincasa hispida]
MGQKFNSARIRKLHIRFPMNQRQRLSLYHTHIKLLGFDINSLNQKSSSSSSSDAVSFSRNGYAVSCSEIVGVVVSHDLKPNRFLKFSVDDGTACVGCILWLNHLTSPYFASRHQPDVRIMGNVATHFAAQIRVGIVARVRGKLSSYRGVVQITVSDVVVEEDPNAEILHWLDSMSCNTFALNLNGLQVQASSGGL